MPDNRTLKKGEILFLQGENPVKLYMLQEGEIEILSAPEEFMGLDSDIIIDKSVRVSSFKGKAMLIGFSGLLVSKYGKSARAVIDSVIVEYPISQGGFKGVASKDINGSINMLRQIFNNYMLSQAQLKKALSLYTRLSQVEDNLLLLYHDFSTGNGPELFNKKSEDLYSVFSFNKGKFPEVVAADFIIEDKSALLKKSYTDKLIKEVLGSDYAELIKKILKLEPQIMAGMIKNDPEIAVSIFSSVASAINGILDNVHDVMDRAGQKAKVLFGSSESWAGYFSKQNGIKDWNSTGRLSPDFFANMMKINAKLDLMYFEAAGKRLASFPGYSELAGALSVSEVRKDEKPAEDAGAAETSSSDISAPNVVSTGLQKSIFQIFEFSMIEKEFQNRMLKLLNDYKTISSSASAESDARKMRRHIAQLYWDLYQQVFVRSKSESSVPKAAKLMLTFGFLDDQLLVPEHLVELNDLARIRERETEIPVVLEYEFLSKIYSGAEEPSITEMGLTYEAFLREMDKSQKKRDPQSSGNNDDLNIQKTLHEISQRLKTTAAVCSGSTVTAFPILTSDIAKGSLKNMYVSKSKLNAIAKKLIDIDFSLFYRETVLRLDQSREIIQEEIFPYLVLVPTFGTKTLLWQELSGNNKRSMGRFMIPILFNGDLEKSLTHAFACFRWELTKNIKGAMWADPIEGGVTGEYFDYVNNFKKNSKLSPEMKEKINLRFKSLRTNRDRFADDYMLWVEYEREGIMKLNTVVREMFFKNIPFKKEIRDHLENMPAFTKYANRYKNIQARDYAAYERRFKKYQDASGNYPKEIQTYFEFLKM
jgi:CRP-like cAMP-binding protein